MPLNQRDFGDGDGPHADGGPRVPDVHPLVGLGRSTGRVITVLDPDGYVLVDGLLVRGVLIEGYASIGDEVDVEVEGNRCVLTARGAGEPPDRGPAPGRDTAVPERPLGYLTCGRVVAGHGEECRDG